MRQLGWKISLDASIELCKAMGVKANHRGALVVSEKLFLDIVGSQKLSMLVANMQEERRTAPDGNAYTYEEFVDFYGGENEWHNAPKLKLKGKHRIRRRNSSTNKNKNHGLVDKMKLITWTERRNIISSSLSGATQLLLLAHTPVSRKVFQFFQCSDIGGEWLLMADYEINCTSDTYKTFMTFVLLVLILFTIALPATLTFYLVHHRNDLYTAEVQATIGWLYAPFVRGAEFWQ